MIPFDWTSLEDATVQRIKFIPGTRDLCGEMQIEFRTGQVYRYKKVPECHAERLAHSSDPGKYFNLHVRAQFEMEKVT